jgi:hypothetical protein
MRNGYGVMIKVHCVISSFYGIIINGYGVIINGYGVISKGYILHLLFGSSPCPDACHGLMSKDCIVTDNDYGAISDGSDAHLVEEAVILVLESSRGK